MTLPNGDVLVDVRVSTQGSPYVTYDVDIFENFSKVETNINLLQSTLNFIQQAGEVNAADAVNNIPNLLVNGEFNLSVCAPEDEDASSGQVMVPTQAASGEKLVRWADAWFVDEDAVDALDVQSLNLDTGPDSGDWQDPYNGIVLKRGTTASGVFTGMVYQRVDLFADLQNLRNKTIQLGVRYTAATDNEFYLYVDDGVTQSDNNVAGSDPSPAGSGTSRLDHTVDANATKLTIGIVLMVDAPADDLDALVIHQAYCRVGVGTFALPVGSPPAQTARDLVCAQMLSRQIRMDNVLVGSAKDASGYEDAVMAFPLDVPILNLGTGVTQATAYIAGSTGTDQRYAGTLTNPPAWSLTHLRRPWLNRASGDSMSTSGYYHGVQVLFRRVAGDPALSGVADGFQADTMGVAVSVIPAP